MVESVARRGIPCIYGGGETMRRENPSRTDTLGRRRGWKERVRSITAKESNPQIPVRLSSGNILSLVPGQVGGWRGSA